MIIEKKTHEKDRTDKSDKTNYTGILLKTVSQHSSFSSSTKRQIKHICFYAAQINQITSLYLRTNNLSTALS